ncbi:MAG TPA: exodeoxyribonuclease V subunit alpha [Desulfobacteraceae bacterium]|nr:exodeoxyribonuclease V subunit alpha [Desulfobacteraceae bacterium]
MIRSMLEKAVQANVLRAIDLHAGLFVEEMTGGSAPELLLAATLASRSVGDGHICLPLDVVAGQPVFPPEFPCSAPPLERWRAGLTAGGAVGGPGGAEPLILDGNRLYLARYHRCETLIAEDLLRRSAIRRVVDPEQTARLLDRLFPGSGPLDRQKIAAAVAAVKQLVVISGGPGTGKTYTVARLLALLQALAGGGLRIGLAAPTGRAAVRLHESIVKARETMDGELAAPVPDQAVTLHRLLGLMPHNGRFRHNRDNPLHLDLLVIDEASMIDVPLMAAVVEALPDSARLVLLGDRDQLTSVEAGSLFGDVCGSGEPRWSADLCRQISQLTGFAVIPGESGATFADSVVLLHTGYRFAPQSAIGELAAVINSGRRDRLTEVLGKEQGEVVYAQPDPEAFPGWLSTQLLTGFENCLAARDPEEALAALGRFRVLCAVREGRAGVAGINGLAESILRRQGLIRGSERLYRGRPVMIRKNQYDLQLFNGDTGILWPDSEGKLWAWFHRADGELWPIAPARLPEHDTAFATTVHKAQGSEFDDVLFILPFEDNRVLTRELVYTGITRARRKLILAGGFPLLAAAIERRVIRYSGLPDRLWREAAK